MENEDEQKLNINDAGTSSMNCDTNVHTTGQNEVQNRYVSRKKYNNILRVN